MYSAAPALASLEFEHAVQAHAAHYISVVDRTGPGLAGGRVPDGGKTQLVSLRRWQVELGNISAALDTAMQRDEMNWLLSVAQWLGRYLEMSGAFIGMREQYGRLLEAGQRGSSPQLELHAQLGLARSQFRLGRHATAREMAAAAYALADKLGDRFGKSSALNSLGNIDHSLGDYSTAQDWYEQALALLQAGDDACGEAWSLNYLGSVAYRLGNFNVAREMYTQSLAQQRSLGQRFGEASALNNLGNVELEQGDTNAAREFYGQVLVIQRELGDRHGEALSLNNLGITAISQGNYSGARELCGQALGIRREIGDRSGEAASLYGLGKVDAKLGNCSSARERFAQALVIWREIGGRSGEATTLGHLGLLDHNLGNYFAAREWFRQALIVARELGDKSILAALCALAGAVLAELEEWQAGACAMSAGVQQAAVIGYTLEPEIVAAVSVGQARLEAAFAAGLLTADACGLWQIATAILDELVERTLAALQAAGPAGQIETTKTAS